ncbi:MAG: DUF3857 domain-containing protein [Elusimicrobia bacterium]|nr:DUF3857 domain-containing protein [Elusimicrobiota bacterium]
MKKLFVFLLLLSTAPRVMADILYLNKGDEINGAITKLDASGVSINAAGKIAVYPKQDILKIQFVKEYAGGKADPLADETMKELLSNPPQPDAYPNDGYINLLTDMRVEINKDKSYSVTMRSQRAILRERGKSPASFEVINYLPELEKPEIEYAYSVTYSSLTWLNDISVMEGSAFVSYPSYDRAKTMKFAIPNVQTGSILDFSYKIETRYDPQYPFFSENAFRFFEPSKLYRLTVTVPAGLKLVYKEFNMPETRVFSEKDLADGTSYAWEMRDVPSYKEEPDMPPFFRHAPQVRLSLEDSWQSLRGRFEPLLKEKMVITPEIAAKTKELIEGKTSDLEKIEALYNWVAREIKHQPVGMNLYSYIPKNTGEIFSAKAGNTLDKPFLLYAMLTAAGFKPDFAYIKTKDSLFDKDHPNIKQFDMAETLVEAGSKTLFLCPVGDTYRFNELPGYLQEASGLRLLGANRPLLFANPLFDPALEGTEENNAFTLDKDGNLKGTLSARFTGNAQAAWRELKDYKKDDLDKSMEQYAHNLHPQAVLEKYTLENLSDLSKDINYAMSVSIKNYAMKAGKYMILKIPGLNYSAADTGQTERELPLFWYSRSRSAGKISIKLPEGFAVYYTPENISLDAAGQKYSADYSAEKQTLTFSEELLREGTEIPAADYSKYKEFKEALAQFSENWIVLKAK